MLKKCTFCGHKGHENFCPVCGLPLKVELKPQELKNTCKNCGYIGPEKFCPECGQQLNSESKPQEFKNTCKMCGYYGPENYCPDCGSPLTVQPKDTNQAYSPILLSEYEKAHSDNSQTPNYPRCPRCDYIGPETFCPKCGTFIKENANGSPQSKNNFNQPSDKDFNAPITTKPGNAWKVISVILVICLIAFTATGLLTNEHIVIDVIKDFISAIKTKF